MDTIRRHPVLHYDPLRRRLWIAGQRCHHGSAGAVLAGAGLIAARLARPACVLLVATGSLMMAHDWKDRAHWFERGWQSQP